MHKAYWQFGNLYTGKELIMGLPESVVFAEGRWQGFLLNSERAEMFAQMAESHAEWKLREEAEKDEDWQQIIPFGVCKCGGHYVELKRGSNGSHTSLFQKYTLAVGGHVVKEELEKFGSLGKWMEQKFLEEINYESKVSMKVIGLLNDDSDKLGRHHLGIVYLLEGDIAEFRTKKHSEGRLLRLEDLTDEDVHYLDRWSQMIYRQLREQETLDNPSTGSG